METPAINDLSICVATENGSGSASSNNVLFKAIFKMGIPCSSKNMFPSNIQGLPTWYQIRASAEGYFARKDVIDVMVIFNDATAAKDVHRVREGGVILYDDSKPLPSHLKREGVQYLGVPANKLVQKIVPASPLRVKQRNMVYVGALAYLIGIDMQTIKEVLQDTFGKKPAWDYKEDTWDFSKIGEPKGLIHERESRPGGGGHCSCSGPTCPDHHTRCSDLVFCLNNSVGGFSVLGFAQTG